MIIDFNAYVGTWPGQFIDFGTDDLKKLMDRSGIDLAVVSCIGTTFAQACSDPGDDRMIQFVSVGPDVEIDGIPESIRGIRLFPGYQHWDFEGEQWSALLASAKKNGWIVHLSLQYLDPRVLAPRTEVATILDSFGRAADGCTDVKFVISGPRYFDVQSNNGIFSRENVYFDISHVQHPINALPKLLKVIDSSRVLFGTNAPFFYPYTAVFRAKCSKISEDAKRSIFEENARRLLGI